MSSARERVLAAAAKVVAERGAAGLTARAVAAAANTSTMAVYTHFGGMQELRQAVVDDGFRKLAARLGNVRRTADPVADLAAQGWAYLATAVEDRDTYLVMFSQPAEAATSATAWEAFAHLVAAVERCQAAGRFHPAEPAAVIATKVLALTHGVVHLHVTGLFDDATARSLLRATGRDLFVALGDDPDAAARSVERARSRKA